MSSLFVRSRPTTNWAANTAYSLGARRKATLAALGIHFEVTTAGTSHATTEPTWDLTVGNTTADGTVVWTTRGSANTWVASTAYVLGDRVVATTATTAARQNYTYEVTTAGTSGASEPSWVTTTPDTSTTTDNTVTWTLRKCSSWDNAHIKFEKILGDTSGTGKTNAGDTIYVGDEHTQTQATTISFNWPGTRTNPNNIICVSDTGDPTTPTTLASTATIQTTGSGAFSLASGCAYFNGIKFQSGDSTGNASIIFGSNLGYFVFENCFLEIRGSSSSAGLLFQTSQSCTIVLNNTPVKFASSTQGFKGSDPYIFHWFNTSNAVQGTVPGTLFTVTADILIQGVDLSGVTGSLFSVATTSSWGNILLSNCKLAAGVSLTAGTSLGLGVGNIRLVNCDSGATNTRLNINDPRGTITQELTLVRSGGASDGTSPVSWKMASVATLPRFSFPLPSLPIVQWNDATGSSKTLTVEILHDSATNLQDDEIWVEVDYLGSSSFPISSFVRDSKADILAAAADQSASSVTWTTTGLSNPNKQKLSVSFTPQMKGPVKAVVYLAKPSKTVYVDPLVTIT